MSIDLARAASLRQTINSPGWEVAMEIMKQFVEAANQALADCDDTDKILGLQREYRALRNFQTSFAGVVSRTASISAEDEIMQQVAY